MSYFKELLRFLDAALYPSTKALLSRCYNIVASAIIVFVSFAVLAGIVILLNMLLDYLLKDVSDSVRNLVSPVADLLPAVFVVASAVTGVIDIVKLTTASLKSSDNSGSGSSK